jgi:urease alpha subunit
VGKRADIVLWDRNPFSIYARTETVFIDGAIAWDRRDARYQPRSDFDLGQPGEGAR